MTIHPDVLYDAAQVAEHLNLAKDTVYRMNKRGVLPATRVGPRHGLVRWSGRTLLRYIHGED